MNCSRKSRQNPSSARTGPENLQRERAMLLRERVDDVSITLLTSARSRGLLARTRRVTTARGRERVDYLRERAE